MAGHIEADLPRVGHVPCSDSPQRRPLFSVCIPSFNRPKELGRLLRSLLYAGTADIEVVICEDCSPSREEVRAAVRAFSDGCPFPLRYFENEQNYGYDRNLRELILRATGEFVVFMGDDDEFVPGGLGGLARFLLVHKDDELGYVLKTHLTIHRTGSVETFRYYRNDRVFEPGLETYVRLFRRSVFISGFVIRRDWVLPYLVELFDGTLLFQLYLLAEVALRHRCAFFAMPLTLQYRGGVPFFGSSDSERSRYDPGTISIRNSVNFMRGFCRIASYIDSKYGLSSTDRIRREISKYSYPVLSIQRCHGRRHFATYTRELRPLGLGCTPYYYAYWLGLFLLGERACDKLILFLKHLLGRTPVL